MAKEMSGLYLDSPDIKTINIDFSDLTNQVYFQTLFAQKFLIGTGVEFKFLNLKSEMLASTSTIIDKSNYLSAFGYMKYDSFDNKHFPKKGSCFSGDIQSYLLSSDYTKTFKPFSIAKADFAIAKTVLKKTTLKFQADGGFSFGNQSLPFFNFALGGFGYTTLDNFKHFYGYDFLGIAANSYLKAATTIDYEIFKKNHINLSANFANLQDNLFHSLDWLSIPKYSGYALGYGLETIIGPIEIKHSWSPETGKGYTWFSVGFWF
jgi:NTE family protein